MLIDLSYSKAIPLITNAHDRVDFILVGAGGTGGFLIGAIARLMYEIEKISSKTATCTIVDPDIVEEKNIPRQNFLTSDIDLPKSQVLAARYALAMGVKIRAICKPFSSKFVQRSWRSLTIIVGCVDNAAARQEINRCLETYSTQMPSIWWLDCGNHQNSGQVLLGSSNQFTIERAFNNYQHPSFCIHLPSPSLLHPELLEPQSEELVPFSTSCAELIARNQQSLFVNQQIAAIASDYLLGLTLTGSLQKFATYFHMPSGAARSLYIDRDTLQRYSISPAM